MGTRAIIRVVQDDKVYVTIYRQFDGYPDVAGRQILDAIGHRKIVNGMSGQQASSIANGAGCLAALLVAGLKEEPGNIYLEPEASDAGVAPPPPPVQAPPAAAPAGQQTLGAVDPPKEEAPAKAPRKSLDEQRAENRATVDQTIVTIREYEDLKELETWAAGWKASKTRTALPSALRQEVDKVLEEHRARLREAGAQEEPGASG